MKKRKHKRWIKEVVDENPLHLFYTYTNTARSGWRDLATDPVVLYKPRKDGREGQWFASLNAAPTPWIGPCDNKLQAMKLARTLYPKHPLFDYILPEGKE